MTPNPVEGLPHDIHGLLPYRPSLIERWPWFLGAAFAVLALALAWRWWRRHQGKRSAVKPVDPWEALDARLATLLPPEPFVGRARETYFYELSIGLREAIERRTELRATDMTLSELREPLRRKLPLPPAEIDALLTFLTHADLVKFAAAEASRAEALDAQQRVRRWAASLKPRPELAAAEAARASEGREGRSQVVGLPSERAGIGEAGSGSPSSGPWSQQGSEDPGRRGPP